MVSAVTSSPFHLRLSFLVLSLRFPTHLVAGLRLTHLFTAPTLGSGDLRVSLVSALTLTVRFPLLTWGPVRCPLSRSSGREARPCHGRVSRSLGGRWCCESPSGGCFPRVPRPRGATLPPSLLSRCLSVSCWSPCSVTCHFAFTCL